MSPAFGPEGKQAENQATWGERATQWPSLSLCGQGWGYQLPGFPALAEEASLRPSSPPQARPLCPHACLALLDTGLALEVLRHRLEPRHGARATWSSALGTGGVEGPVPPPQAVRGLQAERKWWGGTATPTGSRVMGEPAVLHTNYTSNQSQ